MKKIILGCLMMSFALSVFSQSVEEQKKKINAVKKIDAYIYAEATLENEQDAFDLAQELLYQRVNEYAAQKKKFKDAKEAVIMNQNYATEQIRLPRGNMYRAFLFVKKTDIIPTENAVVGRRKAESSQGESSFEVIQNNSREATLNAILSLKTLSETRTKLAQLKQEGRVISYAGYKDLANPENFILIIYDKQGEVKAVLSEGKQRTNLKTKVPDEIKNYKGTGAVGVKIK